MIDRGIVEIRLRIYCIVHVYTRTLNQTIYRLYRTHNDIKVAVITLFPGDVYRGFRLMLVLAAPLSSTDPDRRGREIGEP